MRNRNLYIMALMATIFSGSATAGISPFAGSEAGEGIFYLYNADTGLWLQNNDRRTDHFTTRAELDTRGFDVEIRAEGNGYRLNPRFGGNHSINGGENLYMDTGDAVTVWHLNRAEDSDVPNAYRIESESGSLGMGDDGFLTGCATDNNIWQLVSRQERIEAMGAGAINNPVDVTWLVQDPNFGLNDERYAAWNARFEGGNNPIAGDDKVRCNRAHESWNSASIDMRQTITDIPNGIYRVSVQGYYRDGDGVNRYENGTEELRSYYFANDQTRPLMSTFAGGKDVADDNHDICAGGKWAPNSLGNASLAFFNGEYKNEPLVVEVTDGTLTIGLTKISGAEADWTVFDNWKVEYLGNGDYSSPFSGHPVTEGSFYLYNVESGMWLQNNGRRTEHFTTRAELDNRGFDVVITREGNGYRIDPRFGGNHSINGGENLYMDTGDPVTIWNFDEIKSSRVSNAYTIGSESGQLGIGDDGFLTGCATGINTWQLVSREERMKTLETASQDNPVDVTWLVDCPDFGLTDDRYGSWNAHFEGGGNSRGGHDRLHCNTVHESWNSASIDMQQTISGLPDGTYRVSLQGYYRDSDGVNRFENGTEVLRTRYFANQVSKPLMSVFAGGADQADDCHDLGAGGKWAPNSMNNASIAFFNGEYQNEPILVAVTDGILTIGLSKTSGAEADWTVFDNWKIEYLGTDINSDNLVTALEDAINEAEEYAGKGTAPMNDRLAQAIDEARKLTDSNDLSAIIAATAELNALTDGVKQVAQTVGTLTRTIEIAETENLSDSYATAISEGRKALGEATSRAPLEHALQEIRMERKINATDKHENVFSGSVPAAGIFYLYNVGQKQFLCGGSDWGAHAALGFPGIPFEIEGGIRDSYRIRTGLDNGGGDWLNHNGYCDTPDRDSWSFVAVDDKERVYNIVQSSNKSVGLAFNPYAVTDAGAGVSFHTTVGSRETDLDSENAQWMLISKAERDALLDNASPENPIDASYLIRMPNFSQREYGNATWNQENGAWTHNIGDIDGRGSRRDDFVFMVADAHQAFEITQTITGLPAGMYQVSVQGFYRNGSLAHVSNVISEGGALSREAILYANENDSPIACITEEADMAPGYGLECAAGELPDGCISAANYFQNGLYKNCVETVVGNDGVLYFGVVKERTMADDWLAIDNFRLTYAGPSVSSGIISTEAETKNCDTRIFTISGTEVKEPLLPGIYIRGGKKIVVK